MTEQSKNKTTVSPEHPPVATDFLIHGPAQSYAGFTCALCGEQGKPVNGWHLFYENCRQPVCPGCAAEHAPKIWRLYDSAQKEYDRTREQLLSEAAQKPVAEFIQFDAFLNVEPGDAMVTPDHDGDQLFAGARFELRRSDDVIRLQIPVGTRHDDAVRAAGKILAWIQRDPDLLKFRAGPGWSTFCSEADPSKSEKPL